MAEGLRWMGVPEEQIAAAMRPPGDEGDDFGIWEENWPTWHVFMLLADQWLHKPCLRRGAVLAGGPPPTQIESTLRLLEVPRRERRTMFEDIKAMVGAVLDVDAKLRAG